MNDFSSRNPSPSRHPEAIAASLNQNLSHKFITAKVSIKGNHLRIILEADEVPNQKEMVDFICNAIPKLNIVDIDALQVFGRQIGDELPAWSQTISLKTPPSSYSANQQSRLELNNARSKSIQSSTPIPKSKNSTFGQSSSSISSSGIDSSSSALLLAGCFLTSLIFLAINPAVPIFSALFALGPALVASNKGRNPLNWWCYGFLLFIVAIFHVAVTPGIPERVEVTQRQFWRGVRIAAIALSALCIVSYQFTEEGSAARVFFGIGALASIIMSVVSWTQKV